MNKRLMVFVLILFVVPAFLACAPKNRANVWMPDREESSVVTRGDKLKIHHPEPEEAAALLEEVKRLRLDGDSGGALATLAEAIDANGELMDNKEVQDLYNDLLWETGTCKLRRRLERRDEQ